MSIEQIKADATAEFSTRLFNGEPIPAGSCESITADFIAALACANQCTREQIGCTPDNATGDLLKSWGKTLCAPEPFPATTATGTITAYGVPGAPVPTGETFDRCGDVSFKATEATVISADGSADVPVIACETGSDSNTPEGYEFTWSGGKGLSGTLSGGSCVETDRNYQRRVSAALKERACKITTDSYVGWALQYPGVTRIWPIPNGNGPGTVKLYVAMDGTYPNGIPTAADLQAIQDLVFGSPQGAGLQGIGPVGKVCAPTLCPVNITFAGGTTVTERAAIIARLEDWFLTFGKPETAVCRADLEAAIAGLTAGCVRIQTPQIQQCGAGQIPVLGTITW